MHVFAQPDPYGPYPNEVPLAKRTMVLLALMAVIAVSLLLLAILR